MPRKVSAYVVSAALLFSTVSALAAWTGTPTARYGLGAASSAVFLEDSRLAIATSIGVEIWDPTTGQMLTLLCGRNLDCVSYSEAYGLVAAGGRETPVQVWELKTERLVYSLEHENPECRSLAFSPSGRLLAAASDSVEIWDMDNGELLHTLPINEANSVVFSLDGTQLFADAHRTFRVWDINCVLGMWDLEVTVCVVDESTESWMIESVDFVKLSSRGVLYGVNGDEIYFEPYGSSKREYLDGHWADFSNDGSLIAYIEGTTLKVYDIDADETTRVFDMGASAFVEFSPDGKFIITGTEDRQVRLWDLNANGCSDVGIRMATLTRLSYSSDGKFLAASNSMGTCWIWDTGIGELHKTVSGYDAVFIPGTHTLALSTGGYHDKYLSLVDLDAGQETLRLEGHRRNDPLAVSPDGRFIADSEVNLWDISTGQLVRHRESWTTNRSYIRTAFSSNSALLAVGNDYNVDLWDFRSGEIIYSLVIPKHEHPNQVFPVRGDAKSLSFYPTPGGFLAAGDGWNGITIWSTNTGQIMRNWYGRHADQVAFSPSGTILASTGANQVLLWDWRRKDLIDVLGDHACDITSIAFTPDGLSIASASEDGIIYVWDISQMQQ